MALYGRRSLLIVALVAAGCSSPPPPTEKIQVAEAALRQADTRGAAEAAPLELRLARDKLEEARVAMADERYVTARRLAEQAQVDALLAEAKAQSAAALTSAREMQQSIESLRSEAERAVDQSKEPAAPLRLQSEERMR